MGFGFRGFRVLGEGDLRVLRLIEAVEVWGFTVYGFPMHFSSKHQFAYPWPERYVSPDYDRQETAPLV